MMNDLFTNAELRHILRETIPYLKKAGASPDFVVKVCGAGYVYLNELTPEEVAYAVAVAEDLKEEEWG